MLYAKKRANEGQIDKPFFKKREQMRAKWPNQVGWVFASNVRVWPFAWNR